MHVKICGRRSFQMCSSMWKELISKCAEVCGRSSYLNVNRFVQGIHLHVYMQKYEDRIHTLM
jgi:hypothetical protein